MGIYGRAVFANDLLTDTALDDKDLDQYYYDEEEDCYRFEGRLYNSDADILEILLQRKISQQQKNH